LTAEIKA